MNVMSLQVFEALLGGVGQPIPPHLNGGQSTKAERSPAYTLQAQVQMEFAGQFRLNRTSKSTVRVVGASGRLTLFVTAVHQALSGITEWTEGGDQFERLGSWGGMR